MKDYMNNEQTIELSFKFSIDAVNVILTALNEVAMPKKFTQPVADYIAKEANEQIQVHQKVETKEE